MGFFNCFLKRKETRTGIRIMPKFCLNRKIVKDSIPTMNGSISFLLLIYISINKQIKRANGMTNMIGHAKFMCVGPQAIYTDVQRNAYISFFVAFFVMRKIRIEEEKLKRIISILDARIVLPKSKNERLTK